MDEFVRTKLEEWNLQVLVKPFQENAVDEEVFHGLEDSLIKDLVPQVGYRIKFVRKYKDYLASKAALEEKVDLPSTDVSPTESQEGQAESQSSVNSIDNSEPSVSTTKPCLDRPTTSNTGEKQSTLEPQLNASTKGKAILAEYRLTGELNKSKLADFLINRETDLDPDTRISAGRFTELSEQIAATFKNESKFTFYTPWRKNASGLGEGPSGVLYTRYTNRRRVFRDIGLITNSRTKSTTTDEQADPEVDDAIAWLKNNLEPLNEVQDKWKLTCRRRIKLVKDLSVEEYYETYKCLMSPTGYVLLDLDFETLHGGYSNKLFTEWPTLARRLIIIASKRKEQLVKDFLNTHKDLVSKGTIEVLALLILPLLLGTACIKNHRAGGHWRPSKIEVQQSFMLHIETIDELQPKLEERIKKYEKYSLTNQPLPVICGPLDKIASSLLLINETRYALPSPLKALDACFKSFFALRGKYPVESNHVWIFIEKYVYGIKESAKSYTAVNTLVTQIEALKESEDGML